MRSPPGGWTRAAGALRTHGGGHGPGDQPQLERGGPRAGAGRGGDWRQRGDGVGPGDRHRQPGHLRQADGVQRGQTPRPIGYVGGWLVTAGCSTATTARRQHQDGQTAAVCQHEPPQVPGLQLLLALRLLAVRHQHLPHPAQVLSWSQADPGLVLAVEEAGGSVVTVWDLVTGQGSHGNNIEGSGRVLQNRMCGAMTRTCSAWPGAWALGWLVAPAPDHTVRVWSVERGAGPDNINNINIVLYSI